MIFYAKVEKKSGITKEKPILCTNLRIQRGRSEWKAHSKMEGKITTKLRVDNREMLFTFLIGRIDGFHTHIKTSDKEIEVETESQAVADSQILQDILKLKPSTGLVVVGA